jgi:LPXTG-motif cell wall-anchored protein
MSRRFLAVFCLALAILTLAATGALAQGGTKQVALVVSFPGNNNQAEIVTVPASATALDVLQKSSFQVVSSSSGGFGPAVCAINGTGCPATNCFCDKSHFWAYYHLDPQTGKWVASQEGVGAYKPANGAVEGFVWSGVDANFNPTDQPPVMTFDQVKAQSGAGIQAGAAVTTTQPAVQASAPVTTTQAPPAALPTTGGVAPLWPAALGGLLLCAGAVLAWRSRVAGV